MLPPQQRPALWAGMGTVSFEGLSQLLSPRTPVTRDDALAVCHQPFLWPVCSLGLMKPCFESTKCPSLPTALNAWEAGEMSKGYLLLSEEQSWHHVLWLGK